MRASRILGVAVGATIAGFFVGVILSGDDNVSAGAWVGTAALVVVVVAVRDLLAMADVEFEPLAPFWTPSPAASPPPDAEEFKALRSAIVGGLARPSSFDRSLRPRLSRLTEHYLPGRHGLDPTRDRERVESVLGDVAWLIDPSVEDRHPTHDELSRFLSIVTGVEESQTEGVG